MYEKSRGFGPKQAPPTADKINIFVCVFLNVQLYIYVHRFSVIYLHVDEVHERHRHGPFQFLFERESFYSIRPPHHAL